MRNAYFALVMIALITGTAGGNHAHPAVIALAGDDADSPIGPAAAQQMIFDADIGSMHIAIALRG